MSLNTISRITDPAAEAKYYDIVDFLNSLYNALTGDVYLRDLNLGAAAPLSYQPAGSEEFKWVVSTVNADINPQYEIFTYNNFTSVHTAPRASFVLIIAVASSGYRSLMTFETISVLDRISASSTSNDVSILLNGTVIATSTEDIRTTLTSDGFQVIYLK